jgi:hypothetical protein
VLPPQTNLDEISLPPSCQTPHVSFHTSLVQVREPILPTSFPHTIIKQKEPSQNSGWLMFISSA